MDKRAKLLIALASFCAVLYGGFIFIDYRTQTYPVWDNSMEPALHAGAIVYVVKSSEVERGSIIVFQPPGTRNVRTVGRVIALSGETVEVVDHRVRVNGRELHEPYVKFRDETAGDALPPTRIASGEYWVMTDNRRAEHTGAYGIPKAKVIGRVFLAFSPKRGVWRP